MIKKAIIPAAGLGTRFLPITKTFPKEMLPIVDTPCLSIILKELKNSGIEEVCLIISKQKEMIKEYFKDDLVRYEILKKDNKNELANLVINNDYGLKVSYVYQEEQLGLGHAVYQCKDFIKDDKYFAILLGDDIFDGEIPAIKQLIDTHGETKTSVLGCISVKKEDTNKYGICIPKNDNNLDNKVLLKGVIEKPNIEDAPSNLAISGRYLLNSKIFSILETTKPGKGGEIQLTDAILELMKYDSVYAISIESSRHDIGSKFGFVRATIEYALKNDEVKEELITYLKQLKF